jgi:two-component system phosphate regulon sensor histidine kinase PhoR
LKERAFEFGFRSATGDESGAGLGLSFVKRVVEMHKGQVRECGQPGLGSKFVIELPSLAPKAKGVK